MAQAVEQLNEGKPLAAIWCSRCGIYGQNSTPPLLSDNWMEGQILFIDHFENIVVNITHEQFEQAA